MRYDYSCRSCNKIWEENHSMIDRDLPLSKPCPECNNMTVVRCVSAPAHSTWGNISVLKRAGSGWNDVLLKLKSGSGRGNTIVTR